MSDKRFVVETGFIVGSPNNSQLIIYDNQGIDDYYFLGNDKKEVKGICDLLNQLNDDNLQLKTLLQEAEEEISKLKKSNTLLMESVVKQESENNPEKNLRFGKFRQKMCDLLWENGCDHMGLSDERNAELIFNQSHNICNSLLEDYNITDK